MRFVILCVGTDGDVLPMMAIGSKLVELGHLVEITAVQDDKESREVGV